MEVVTISILGYYLLPHPPIVLPEVGKGEENKIKRTKAAFNRIGQEIAEKAPRVIILITPHGTMFQDVISLSYEDTIQGDMARFRAPSVSMEIPIHKPLTRRIYDISRQDGIATVLSTNSFLRRYNASVFLDHGAIVPLYFINQYYKDYKLVHITYAPFGDMDLYKFGIAIRRAVDEQNETAVLIASGDLSHRLKEDGPYDYSPLGEKFDKEFLHYLKQGDAAAVFRMDRETIREAGECGRNSTIILLGALEGCKFHGELLSYEGTFGVGYGIMRLQVVSQGPSQLHLLEEIRKGSHQRKQNQKDPYVKLARESLSTYLMTGKELDRLPSYVTEDMKIQKRGVFVSLKKNGNLRGCIGTIFPTRDNVAWEIVRNSIEAGVNDPRFFPIAEDELLDIDFSVDVLTEPVPTTKEELNPKIYGVIVQHGGKRGLLLPDLEGVDTVEEQLAIALQKAGIKPSEKYSIQRFMVIRHKEE